MQRSERISKESENIIFDSSNPVPQEMPVAQVPQEIMNIPGTPHEKLVSLAEMV